MNEKTLKDETDRNGFFEGDLFLSEKPLKITLDDFLPETNELANFGLLMRNRVHLLDETQINEGCEERLKAWEGECRNLGIDPVSTFNALLISCLFQMAQNEVVIEPSYDGGINEY